MSDLSLVPLEDLKEAIYDRCDQCVMITKRNEDSGHPVIRCTSKTGSSDGVGLATVAQKWFLALTMMEDEDKPQQDGSG